MYHASGLCVCVYVQDFLGKSDPYLEFAKQNTDGTFTIVHRTQVLVWNAHTCMCFVCVFIDAAAFCNFLVKFGLPFMSYLNFSLD